MAGDRHLGHGGDDQGAAQTTDGGDDFGEEVLCGDSDMYLGAANLQQSQQPAEGPATVDACRVSV